MGLGTRITLDAESADGRFARQELISWWDQSRLAGARLLVVGAGALGNELIKCFALLGVGRLTVVDFDRIERSNLARGVLMREEDVGRSKVEVVSERARELNPEVEIDALDGDLRAQLGVGLVAEHDVVLGGLDSRLARLRLNALCRKAGVPFVDGAIEGLMGVVRVFTPDSACYECTLSDRALALLNQRRSCALLTGEEIAAGRTPTTATSASVIAGMQAQEAIKILQEAPGANALAGRGFVFNGLTHDSYVVEYPFDEHCLAHDTYELDDTIPPSTSLAELVAEAERVFGDDAFAQLEHELVTRLECPGCGAEEHPNRIAVHFERGGLACSECGAERRATLVHRLRGELDAALAEATLADLGLPQQDVVTLYDAAGVRRQHRVVGAVA